MRQRNTSNPWSEPTGGFSPRVRVLVESADPVVALSDFARFRRAGLDVAVCTGPGKNTSECPLVADGPCPLAAQAEVVFHGLGANGVEVLDALRRNHSRTPILVQLADADAAVRAGVPDDCLVLPLRASVEGQIDALRGAAVAGRQRKADVRASDDAHS